MGFVLIQHIADHACVRRSPNKETYGAQNLKNLKPDEFLKNDFFRSSGFYLTVLIGL